MEKLLFDTDIGTDIDDAVCLAYLLSQPKCELMGITTVTGEPVKRAMLASAICKAGNQSIPIYPGTAEPLLVKQRQAEAQQYKAIGNWDHDKEFPEGQAIDFMRTTIRKYPGQITLLAVGPLTNIALLFKVDPEIPSLIKQLVLMCGKFTLEGREWNALLDPHATAIVYNSRVQIHRSIGIDVTQKVQMSSQEVKEKFKAPVLQPVLDFSSVWFEKSNLITFHDPLAAATIFEQTVCSFSKGRVEVDVSDSDTSGTTKWQEDRQSGPHEVALQVERDKYFDHFFSIVK